MCIAQAHVGNLAVQLDGAREILAYAKPYLIALPEAVLGNATVRLDGLAIQLDDPCIL